MNETQFKEKKAFAVSGWPIILLGIIILAVSVAYYANKIFDPTYRTETVIFNLALINIINLFVVFKGMFVINPNQSVVFLFFGHYVGIVRNHGLQWTIPVFTKLRVSLKVRNFESGKIKVNDYSGNPIEVATIIVWRVLEPARVIFEVQDYVHFTKIQSESSLRNLVMQYPYDSYDEDGISLIKNTEEISQKLLEETQSRLKFAGIEILEARISHLAYSPEIAAAMLQRQQAKAVVAARKEIVEGAVGIIELALNAIEDKKITSLDNTAKAKMIANMMVVLSSESNTQPTIETSL